jgi:hypothetical protein
LARRNAGYPDYVTCATHDKRGYYSKKEAERAARMYHPGEHLDVFPCSNGTGLWHCGHLPEVVVKRGFVDRQQATVRRRPR